MSTPSVGTVKCAVLTYKYSTVIRYGANILVLAAEAQDLVNDRGIEGTLWKRL